MIMKSKIEKYLKYVAATAFLVAFVINVIVTLDDPFVYMNDEAIATGSTGSSTGTGGDNYFVIQRPTSKDTTYTTTVGCPAGEEKAVSKSTTTTVTTCPFGGGKSCFPGTSTITIYIYGNCKPL